MLITPCRTVTAPAPLDVSTRSGVCRWRVAARAMLAAACTTTGAMMLACSSVSQSVSDLASVRGTYTLRTVDGTPLPTHFVPFDDAERTAVRLDSGRVTFDSEGEVRGAWHGSAESGDAKSRVLQGTYVQDGMRVLIHTGTGLPPDTGEVSGKTLTVRAQFYRQPSREPYVIVMTYER